MVFSGQRLMQILTFLKGKGWEIFIKIRASREKLSNFPNYSFYYLPTYPSLNIFLHVIINIWTNRLYFYLITYKSLTLITYNHIFNTCLFSFLLIEHSFLQDDSTLTTHQATDICSFSLVGELLLFRDVYRYIKSITY